MANGLGAADLRIIESSFTMGGVSFELFECRSSTSGPAYMTDAHTEVQRVQDHFTAGGESVTICGSVRVAF